MGLRNVTWTIKSTGDEPMSGLVHIRSMVPHQNVSKPVQVTNGAMNTILTDNTRYMFSIDLYDTSGNAHDSNGAVFLVDVPPGTGTYLVRPVDTRRVIDEMLGFYPSAYGMTNRRVFFYG